MPINPNVISVGRDFARLPIWLQNQLEAFWMASGFTIVQASGPRAFSMPQRLDTLEDTASVLDLTNLKVNKLANKNAPVTLVFEVNAGTLDATPWRKVSFDGEGTSRLEISGQLKHVQRYLKKVGDVLYTGAENIFGEASATLTLSMLTASGVNFLGASLIDITDTPDNFIGTDQDDTLFGDNGINTIQGLAGDDDLFGLAGVDVIQGDAGDDTISGGADGDTLDGGADNDVLLYRTSDAAVTVDLNADGAGLQSATGGHATGDVISNFEHVYASDHGDMITGNAGRNILFGYSGDDTISGGDGDDVIRGGEGADVMDGGDGSDWLRYVEASSGVNIDLNADGAGFQSASGGEAAGDVISNFENVQGSEHADVITGDSGANYLIANEGDDTVDGGAGRDIIRGGAGADRLEGGADIDTLQYAGSAAGVVVDLNADGAGLQSANGGDASGDVISGFENVYATNHDDVLTGDAGRNILYGYAGSDQLNGGDGKDVLRGGSGADEFIFNTALGSNNIDRIIDFEIGLDQLMLDAVIFTGLTGGLLSSTAFHINGTGLAESASHHIIYDTTTNTLYFDADGTGAVDGQAFATLSSAPALDASDFFIF